MKKSLVLAMAMALGVTASCELPSFLYSAHCFASILSSTHYKQVKKQLLSYI